MVVNESTYLFSLVGLQRLSYELARPHFKPTDAQKVVLEQALRLLDLELSYQASEHPEFIKQVEQLLSTDSE